MSLLRSQIDLRELAGQYANARRIPMATVIKEILHYEILYALTESGASSNLIFQGGTALRLCYQGTRYSEDLDFASGQSFEVQSMEPFVALLQSEIASAYGLEVDVKAPAANKEKSDEAVPVARWCAKILIPNADLSFKQKQVINIEVASVPAHDPDLVSVAVNYPHLPEPLRQMMIMAESRSEILADKLVALGARPFLKARDLWDIKFLTDASVVPDFDLVRTKISDYGWEMSDFCEKLESKLQLLGSHETMKSFQKEMSRFVDTRVAKMLDNPSLSGKYISKAKELGEEMLHALNDGLRLRP